MKDIMAIAKVKIEVEISCSGSWGSNCTVEQVHKQAAEAAINTIRCLNNSSIRVIGTPIVSTITFENK